MQNSGVNTTGSYVVDSFLYVYTKSLQQGFGIILVIIGTVGAILASVFATLLPMVIPITFGVLSLAGLSGGIYLTIRGFTFP